MTAVAARRERRRNTTQLNPAEAAYVTGLSVKTVNQTIDRREITPLPARREGDPPRAVGFPEAVYLAMRGRTDRLLSAEARQALYKEIQNTADWENPEMVVRIGPVAVHLDDIIAYVRARLDELREVGCYVDSDPEIRGGEPVVAGTRVPVHRLAELVERGAPREEILEDHPAVTPDALDAALVYARLHPRRGRPRGAPWHGRKRAVAGADGAEK